MRIWIDYGYGADADGNRAIMGSFYELEHTVDEKTDIAEILLNDGIGSTDKGNVTITYEDMEIVVAIEDYTEIIKELEKENE